jgi:hypothetical protein
MTKKPESLFGFGDIWREKRAERLNSLNREFSRAA